MSVALQGNSPSTLIAGILLLSRARSFGHRLAVEIVGDPDDITPVEGPALVHSAVLASCGIGRELGAGALVIVPGADTTPLAVCTTNGGVGEWFEVDRSGQGVHPGTRAFVALCRDPRLAVRDRGRRLRRAWAMLGCAAEPAVFDLMFCAPLPPLTRLSLGLRAGRALARERPAMLSRFLSHGDCELLDPLGPDLTLEGLAAARAAGDLDRLLDRLSMSVRDGVLGWIDDMLEDPEYAPILLELVAMTSHLSSLPPPAALSPLSPAPDAIAVGLGAALGAVSGESDATQSLRRTFRFLGGRFIDDARYPVQLDSTPPPVDRLARWRWFSEATTRAADTADGLWRRVIDPDQ